MDIVIGIYLIISVLIFGQKKEFVAKLLGPSDGKIIKTGTAELGQDKRLTQEHRDRLDCPP